jgi:hypothetical protein
MSLALHLALHVFTALLAGLISWILFGNPGYSFIGGIVGGVLIDLDHFIDYFFAFRYQWNLSYFMKGYQFLKSDKVYVLFHGWEYLVLVAVIYFFVDKYENLQGLLFALGLGVLFHLVVDVFVNHGMSFRAYLFFYRLKHQFDIKKVVTVDHYKEHLLQKQKVNL